MALQYLHLYGRVIDMEPLWFAAPKKTVLGRGLNCTTVLRYDVHVPTYIVL